MPPISPAKAGFRRGVLVGTSRAFRSSLVAARRAARAAREPVLLTGPAGTGKRLMARAIHHAGCTAGDPFVVLECGGIPEALLARELFGAQGFGDATRAHPGLLQVAAAGTLLIAEITEMPPRIQAELRRALQHGQYTAVDGVDPEALRCRVAATSKIPLDAAAARGEFDTELRALLERNHIRIPPLRQRAGDIPLLARHFLQQAEGATDRGARKLAAAAEQVLMQHSWPGNVRELKLVIDRVAALTDEALILAPHLTIQHRSARCGSSGGDAVAAEICIPSAGKTLRQIEEEAVSLTLQMTRGNRSAAARRLGISRPTLLRKIAALGLR